MSNIVIVKHPILQAKLSHLRTEGLTSIQVKRLTKDIADILAVESTKDEISLVNGPTVKSSLGHDLATLQVKESIVLVPVLRSGLALEQGFTELFPEQTEVPTYHLGVFREKVSKEPIEYYNKLSHGRNFDVAFILDPVIATGGTASSVIESLKECHVSKIIFVGVVAGKSGLERVAKKHPDVKFYIGAVDEEISHDGYLIPGIGDIGDRLNNT